jgi:hypothetical protein
MRFTRPTVRRIADITPSGAPVPFAAVPTTDYDGYWTRLVKLIPGEVVGAWVIISGLLEGTVQPGAPGGTGGAAAGGGQPAAFVQGSLFGIGAVFWYWGAFAFFVVLSAVYMLLATEPQTRTGRIAQAIAAPIAYVVWVIALGGPFQYQAQQPGSALTYNKALASVLLILLSAAIPAVDLLVDRIVANAKAKAGKAMAVAPSVGMTP